MTKVLKFIIGHVRPEVEYPPDFRFVTTSAQASSDFVVSMKELEEIGLTDRRIGEYAYLFALRRHLSDSSTVADSICIAQYRRCVLNVCAGKISDNARFAWMVSRDDAKEILIDQNFVPRNGAWLVSTATRVSTCVTDQYARKHLIRDWFRFLADVLDAGLISESDARDAALTDVLIPAPSNGFFPYQYYIQILYRLEQMAHAYIHSGLVERDGYQRRSMGFCLERMNSHLLLCLLKRQRLSLKDVQGFHSVVNAGPCIVPTL
jgi:hypothetical protein